MSHEFNNNDMTQNLNNQELDQVVGGASAFLKGRLSAELSSDYQVLEFQGGRGPGNFAAKSEPMLDCWEETIIFCY